MDIKEIRHLTCLTQKQFAEKYHIPLQTEKQWESSIGSKSYRKPPEYVLYLLKETVLREITDGMVSMVRRDVLRKEHIDKSRALDEAAESVWG
jgi:transcriptional regulator with XRE-family HTH domain